MHNKMTVHSSIMLRKQEHIQYMTIYIQFFFFLIYVYGTVNVDDNVFFYVAEVLNCVVVETGLCKHVGTTVSDSLLLGQPESHFIHFIFS